jgi:hypothetical protein
MDVQPLARESWHRFLEDFTRTVRGSTAGVEILSCELGDQRLAENAPLLGLSYDERGDILEIELENVGHRVLHPTALAIERLADGLTAIEIVGGDGARTLIRLKKPLLLPQPAHG